MYILQTLADKHKVMMREVQNNKIKQLRAVSKTYSIDEVRACEKDILKVMLLLVNHFIMYFWWLAFKNLLVRFAGGGSPQNIVRNQ